MLPHRCNPVLVCHSPEAAGAGEKQQGGDGASPQQPLSLRSHPFPAALGSCLQAEHCLQPLAGSFLCENKMFLPLSLRQDLPAAISPESPPTTEVRLPSTTWPSRKEGEKTVLQLPGLTQNRVCWSPCPTFGLALLLEETAAGSSGQPSAIGSSRRHKQARSQTAPSLPGLSIVWRLLWAGSFKMPSPFLQLSCAAEALGPQPHLTQQLLCCHQYQVQPVQLPDTCPANFSSTAAARAPQTPCSPPEPAGNSAGQAGLAPGRAGSHDLNFSAKAARRPSGQTPPPPCPSLPGALGSSPARAPTTSSSGSSPASLLQPHESTNHLRTGLPLPDLGRLNITANIWPFAKVLL